MMTVLLLAFLCRPAHGMVREKRWSGRSLVGGVIDGTGDSHHGSTSTRPSALTGWGVAVIGDRADSVRRDLGAPADPGLSPHAPGQP